MKKIIRYCIVFPLAMFFAPLVALAFWMPLMDVYKSAIEHLKSGESFGIFD